MKEKQKVLNSLASATIFLKMAETKKEGDRAYGLMRYALQNYYNIMWGEKDDRKTNR